MICSLCHVVMKGGTSYENRNGRSNCMRFSECPKCRDRRYNNSPNFQELLAKSVSNK